MTVPFDLDGAVAVLTGAGSGIGRATALSFAARGARVAVSDVDEARAEETAALVAGRGRRGDRARGRRRARRPTSKRCATGASSDSAASTSCATTSA